MAIQAKILVVDDELPVCKSVMSALLGGGYEVEMALSGEEALRKDDEWNYDLIITDLMMPGLSGIELLKRITEKRPEVKVIMITGYPSIKTAVQSIKLGAFDYIPKPFTPNELRSLVSRALESKRYHMGKVADNRAMEAEKGGLLIPVDTYSIPENSWGRVEKDGTVRIGIHHVFLRTIRQITSIDFPKVNESRYQGEVCLRVSDSQKNVYNVWTPVSGRVLEINEEIKKDYESARRDPYHQGWMLLIQPAHLEDDLKNLTLLETTS